MSVLRFAMPVALLCALVLSAADCQVLPVKYRTTGIYKDSTGSEHSWSINDAHTLIWNGEPYIPVGATFEASSTARDATDADYAADTAALETLKSKGITDILLKTPERFTSADPLRVQRIIDYLEANGFAYGIQFDEGPTRALSGNLIAPNAYRLEGPSTTTSIVCDWPDVDSAIYAVVRKYDLSIAYSGGAIVRDGKATINLPDPLDSGEVLLVYPRKTLQNTGDVWSGLGECRDRLLEFMGKLKMGAGLRFFLEPLTSKMDFTGEMLGFVPDSAAFRLGLEAYLAKRHLHEGAVNSAWGMNENVQAMDEAARLVPMWTSNRGIPYAYDRASAHMYPVDTTVTQAWHDIVDFRDSSAQSYMNGIADALKKQVADVPVVFKCDSYHRVYANPFGIGGFDGLAAVTNVSDTSTAAQSGGQAYSLAEESGKMTWYISIGSAVGKSVGYPNENALAANLDLMREVGCRGFFVDDFGPGQGEWLVAFADKLNTRQLSELKPTVVWFPTIPATGAYIRRLAPNTWWLPTLRVGTTAYIGDGLLTYTLPAEDRAHIWSISGERAVTLKSGPTGVPSIAFPPDARADSGKGGRYTLRLTDSPTVVRGVDLVQMFPYETAQSEIDKLSKLIPEADAIGLDVKQVRAALDQSKTVLANGQPIIAHGIAESSAKDLEQSIGTVLWAEGELSPAHNFGAAAAVPGASAGLGLVLDTAADPPLAPYSATFRFSPDVKASYEIWVAGTPPNDGCPLSFSTDDTTWQSVSASDGKRESYAPGLAWYKIGSVNAFPGNQIVQFRADDKRAEDGRYYFVIDAVVLSPRPYKPDGVLKP